MVCLRESLPEVRGQIQNLADKLGVDYGTAKIILLENNGYDLDKAPSGAESKLYLTLLEHYNGDERKALIAKAKTYLQPFFNWFGNWTDPETTSVSKVVDENGEPLIVWHGTTKGTWSEVNNDFSDDGISFFTTTNKEVAWTYKGEDFAPATWLPMHKDSGWMLDSGKWSFKIEDFSLDGYEITLQLIEDYYNGKEVMITRSDQYAKSTNKIYSLFARLQNPLMINNTTPVNWDQLLLNGKTVSTRYVSEYAKNNGYDGVIITNVYDMGPYTKREDMNSSNALKPSTVIISHNPNQIKSIDNQGAFSTTDNNIYYKIESYDDLLQQVKENREALLGDIGEFNNSNDLINYLLQLEDIPELLKTLLKILSEKSIQLIIHDYKNGKARASYDGAINLYAPVILNSSNQQIAEDVAHEMLHHYLDKYIKEHPEFKQTLEDLLSKYKDRVSNSFYGVQKDGKEFLHEFMSNGEFRQALKVDNRPLYKKIIDLFVDTIRALFNKEKIDRTDFEIDLKVLEEWVYELLDKVNTGEIETYDQSNYKIRLYKEEDLNQNYQQHSQQAQQELQRQIDNFKTRGYNLDKQETVEKELSAIRKKMLSGMKSILKVVDQIGANKSDEFKANLKYQITNLQDNTISDIENIVYFIKTLSQDLVPVALEILNAVKSNNVLTDERIHSLDRNYFGFYNPLIKDIKDIYTQLEPFSEIIDKDTYRSIGNLLDSCNNILEFSRYNLRRMQVENYKQILAEKAINTNSEYVEEMVDYLKGDVMSADKDIWSITRLFMSPDKVNDKALKTLYQLVQEAENNKALRVYEKAIKLNEIAKGISSFKDLYEVDDNGKTTGYLVRDKQYGKFHKQYNDFLNKLRIQFGMTPNDLMLSEDPEIRKEFAKAKNEWLSHRVERKYTKEFYELFDSLSTEAQYAREQIEIKIRTIQDKYKDTNGFTDKSKITKDDQEKLNELRVEKRLLSSIYNPDGTEKTGIERQIADELSALESKLAEGYVTVKDVKKFNKIVEEKRKSLSKDAFDAWYEANTRVQYSEEFREELRKIDKQRFGARYAELSEQRNQLLSPYRNPQTNEPMVDLIPMVTKRAINRLEIEMMNERKKSKGKKVDISGLYSVVPTSEYQRKRREAERKAEEAATINNVVDPILFEQMMESMFYLQTSHRTMKGWEPNSYYTKIVPVNPDHLEIVPNDNFNMLSPDSKFYNKNYDYNSNEFYQPKSFATEDFIDDNGKKVKKGQRLYDNSDAYKRIQSNDKKKALYDEILSIMEESNNYYSNRTFMNKYKLPQIDGSTLRYMKGKGVLSGLWSKISSYFGRRVDDVGIKEEASTAPDGQKLSMIPQYFTQDLDDPSTISADLIGIVMEYYQSAVNFDEKNKVKAKAETIKSILSRRTYKKTSFGKQENVQGIETQIYKMADSFMDMHIYGMQSKAIKWNLFGREVDITKTIKLLGSFATAVNLMMNYAVAATGMFTSGYQMLVQSVVGRYWDGHDTLNAMKFFVTDMFWTGIRNIGNRHYKSKQWALMDLFGVGSELNTLWKNSNHNGIISALVRRLGWWGMTISDYCTKGLILDAILYNFKYVNGEFISKEDYLDKYGRTDKTKSKWRTYKSAMDSIEFKNGKVRTIDPSMQSAWEKAMPVIGDTARSLAYASDGQLTPLQKAQFTMNAFGGLVMMHRQYLPVVLSERFTLEYQYDPNLRRHREAVIQTIWRFISSIYSDRKELGLLKSISSNWGKFKNDKVARFNLKQASFEAAMLLYVLPQMTAFMVREAEEDDESWWKKFFAYVMMRVQFESGSPYNPMDLYNTIKTPTPAYGPFDNLNNLFSLSYETVRKIIAGEDLSEDEIKKGAYKDKSQLFKTIMKVTPLKNPYEQIMGIEDKIRYYESQIMKEEFEELD